MKKCKLIADYIATLQRTLYLGLLFLCSSYAQAQYAWEPRVSVDLSESNRATVTFEDALEDKLLSVPGGVGKIRWAQCETQNQICPNWLDNNAWLEIDFQRVLKINGTGFFGVVVYADNAVTPQGFVYDDVIWKQLVYIPPSAQPANAEELAKQYLPVVVFNNDEQYFPLSLDEILSFDDGEGSNDTLRIAGPERTLVENSGELSMGDELKRYMETNGHVEAFINFATRESTCAQGGAFCEPLFLRNATGSLNTPTIYWQITEENGDLFLTYHFFYAFDPKLGTPEQPGAGAHAFDRESFTIKLVLEDGKYKPVTVSYAGHLDSQKLEFNGCKNFQDDLCSEPAKLLAGYVETRKGKTTIDWEYINKVGQHPVIYKAKGSHAIFPTLGWYTVEFSILRRLLIEPAGSIVSDQVLFPSDFLTTNQSNAARLVELDLNQQKFLSFSGDWVDVRIAENAQFPPFIRKPYSDWLSPANNDFEFNKCLNGSDISADCSVVRDYFIQGSDKSNLKGLGDYRAVTVRVVDSSQQGSPFLRPGIEVALQSSDNLTILSGSTGSAGEYTFFFKPRQAVQYSVIADGQVACVDSEFSAENVQFTSEDFQEFEFECDVNVVQEPLAVLIAGSTVQEGEFAKFTVSLNFASAASEVVILEIWESSADTLDLNTEQFFDMNRQPIENILLFAPGQISKDVYVQTFDNDPPFGEPLENYIVGALLEGGDFSLAQGGITESDVVTIPSSDIVSAAGKQWAQPDIFTNLSWDDIDAVCPAGVCSGFLNGYDMSGWRWASVEEMNSLFNSYIGAPVLGPGPDRYLVAFDSRWATAFFDAGWRRTFGPQPSVSISIQGLTSSPAGGGSESYRADLQQGFIDGAADSARTNLSWPNFLSLGELGAWFYRGGGGSGRLNDTGIILGANYPSGSNAGCTGVTIEQQDCANGRDATNNDPSDGHAGFSYTKLASSGAELAASATTWACVRDNVTELVWEVKTDDGSIHDKDNTYRWGGKTAEGTGYGTYFSDWDVLVDGTNNEGLCGFGDGWRVPSATELEGLLNYNRIGPAIDIDFFPNTPSSAFWSSSPLAPSSRVAWIVGFGPGDSFGNANRGDGRHVRLVRSGQ